MANVKQLSIVSYNMHGFYQGMETVKDLICSPSCADIISVQEHWLTPANLYLFGETFTTHYAYGCSAMADRVTQGPLIGRPYGVSILIKNELRSVTECMFCTDRFVVVRVGDVIIINVYLPCSGTVDRLSIVDGVLQEAWSWRLECPDCSVIIGGDFNTDLDKCTDASSCINNFANNHFLVRGDVYFPDKRRQTYVNESLGHSSVIDYFMCDSGDVIEDYSVLDPAINFSDHLPIAI